MPDFEHLPDKPVATDFAQSAANHLLRGSPYASKLHEKVVALLTTKGERAAAELIEEKEAEYDLVVHGRTAGESLAAWADEARERRAERERQAAVYEKRA